jgi:copper chaperone CopZ
MTKTYSIEVDCANCANKMEIAAAKVEGVKNVNVSFMALKMTVEFEEGAKEAETMKKVLKACKKIESDCEIYL